MMVEPANLWDLDHASAINGVHGTILRAIHPERRAA
jgi:hypothetical protein